MLGHQSLGAGCARRLARLSRPPRASNSTASWRSHHLCWQRRALASAPRTPKPQSQFNLNPQSKYKHSSRPILNRIPPQTPASSFFCNDSAHSDRFVSSSSSNHRHTVKMATEVRELNLPPRSCCCHCCDRRFPPSPLEPPRSRNPSARRVLRHDLRGFGLARGRPETPWRTKCLCLHSHFAFFASNCILLAMLTFCL